MSTCSVENTLISFAQLPIPWKISFQIPSHTPNIPQPTFYFILILHGSFIYHNNQNVNVLRSYFYFSFCTLGTVQLTCRCVFWNVSIVCLLFKSSTSICHEPKNSNPHSTSPQLFLYLPHSTLLSNQQDKSYTCHKDLVVSVFLLKLNCFYCL